MRTSWSRPPPRPSGTRRRRRWRPPRAARCGTGDGPSWVEPVADAPHGDEVAWLRRVALDLLAQSTDVNGDGCRVAVGEPPDALEELLAPEHLTRRAGYELEEVELPRGECDD